MARAMRNTKAPLFLELREQNAVSFALGVNLIDEQGKVILQGAGKPVFLEPGKCSLKAFYPVGDGSEYIEKIIEIEVPAPNGEDKNVWEILKKDPDLTSDLLEPIGPPTKEAMAKLVELMRLYPRSSYVPYMHFGLARWCAHNGQRAQAVDELLKVRDVPFAYQPNAWILLGKVMEQRKVNGTRQEEIKAYMNREHPEAIEWLEVLAPDIRISDDEWQVFRKYRPAEKRKARGQK